MFSGNKQIFFAPCTRYINHWRTRTSNDDDEEEGKGSSKHHTNMGEEQNKYIWSEKQVEKWVLGKKIWISDAIIIPYGYNL